MGGHLQQPLKGFGPGAIHEFAGCFDVQPVFHAQNARQHGNLPAGTSRHLHGAQLAGTGRLEGRMIAKSGDIDAVFPGHFEHGHPFFGRVFLIIDSDLWHFKNLS